MTIKSILTMGQVPRCQLHTDFISNTQANALSSKVHRKSVPIARVRPLVHSDLCCLVAADASILAIWNPVHTDALAISSPGSSRNPCVRLPFTLQGCEHEFFRIVFAPLLTPPSSLQIWTIVDFFCVMSNLTATPTMTISAFPNLHDLTRNTMSWFRYIFC